MSASQYSMNLFIKQRKSVAIVVDESAEHAGILTIDRMW